MSGKLNYQLYKINTTDVLDEEKSSSGEISSFSEIGTIVGTRQLTIELTGWMTVPKTDDYVFTAYHDDGLSIDLIKDIMSNLKDDTELLNKPAFGTDKTVSVKLSKFNAYKIVIRLTNTGGPAGLTIKNGDNDLDFDSFYSTQVSVWPACYVGWAIIGAIIVAILIVLSMLGFFGKKDNRTMMMQKMRAMRGLYA
jgi:hypothetical protein